MSTDLGFTYKATKDGSVFFYHGKKDAGVVKGKKASKFLVDMEYMNFDAQQVLMARLTGHYKHGNEKMGKK